MSGMTDHPLTEASAIEMWGTYPHLNYWDDWTPSGRADLLAALRAAFDSGREHERTNPEDDRPWEPLDGGPVHVGDEVRQDYLGATTIAVVGHVDRDGDPWTAEDLFIGELEEGTWYIRRTEAEELPTTPGTTIVTNDGQDNIEATFSGIVWRTREAVLCGDGLWHGVWRAGRSVVGSASPEFITPGTWKVEEK